MAVVSSEKPYEFDIFNPQEKFACIHEDGYVSTTQGINSCCGGKHEYLVSKKRDSIHVNILDENHVLLFKDGKIGVKEYAI